MGHFEKVGCSDISNELNTKVAKFVKKQPHWGSNHLLSSKGIKKEQEKGGCHIKLF